MIHWIDELIKKFASLLSRGGLRTTGPTSHITAFFVGLPALILILLLSIYIVPHLFHEATNVESRPFEENLDPYEWVVVYGDDPKSLWTTGIKRDQYEHGQVLDLMPGQFYWMGLQITPEQAARARAVGANQFLIGYFFGSWEVYVDSKLVKKGEPNGYRRPTLITVPEEAFRNPAGFRVSMKIRNDLHEMYPDSLYFSGLGTEAQIETHTRWFEFVSLVSNSAAFGFNMALGLFFLALWVCGVRKQELAAFGAFGLLQAAIQAMTMPLILDVLGPEVSFKVNFILKIYETVLVLWLGLSLARVRSSWVLTSIAVSLAAPWPVLLTPWTANQVFHMTYFFGQWVSPNSYFVAAFICFAQARLVATHFRRELMDPSRVLKLHLSWVALVVMGLIQIYGNHIYFDARILNAVLLMGLSAAVVHDYRRQDLFVRRAPLSKYHQRAELPKRVPCVLATIDLKRSEGLYQYGASRGVGGTYVVEIISRFYRQITDLGGEVIQTEGDAITFFFDRDENADSFSKTVRSIRELDSKLKEHLSDAGLDQEFPRDVRLRAALDIGAIRPTWQKFEGRDVPGWEQAQDSTVFVDVARLLEAESKIGEKGESSLILKDGLREELEKDSKTDLRTKSELVEIKHGRKINVMIASLGA